MAAKKHKGPGRPFMKPEDRRSERVTIRLTPGEYQTLLAECAKARLSLSEYIAQRLNLEDK
jgi:hypothetical protein